MKRRIVPWWIWLWLVGTLSLTASPQGNAAPADTGPATTPTSATIQEGLDELVYVQLQIAAKSTDLQPYFVPNWAIDDWALDDQTQLQQHLQRHLDDLETLQRYNAGLHIPEALAALQRLNDAMIHHLQDVCRRLPVNKPADIQQASEQFVQHTAAAYGAELAKLVKQYHLTAAVPVGEEATQARRQQRSTDEELQVAATPADAQTYRDALRLIADRQLPEAYRLLGPLRRRYEGTAFGDCLALRMSDCLLMALWETDVVVDPQIPHPDEAGLDLLARIVDRQQYSPVLYETFVKWRTTYQEQHHGMSNMSQIPNLIYNEQRWQLIQLIKRHLRDRPDDTWARMQVELLLHESNIRRGGTYGNENLTYAGTLYMDPRAIATTPSPDAQAK